MVEIFNDFYKKAGNEKYIGFHSFLQLQLLIKDLPVIKNVLLEDFNKFVNRGVYYNEAVYLLSAQIFTVKRLHWKNL